MKKGMCALAALALSAPFAANSQSASTGYFSVACVKIQPGKTFAFREFASNESKRLMQTAADNGDVSLWMLLRAVMPAGEMAECDYLSVARYAGTPTPPLSLEKMNQSLRQSGVGGTAQEFYSRRESLARLVSYEMWRAEHRVGAPRKGDYVAASYLKVNDMRAMSEIDSNILKPMAEERLRAGTITAWSANRRVVPSGSSLGYQAMSVYVYPTWNAVFEYPPASEVFKKVHAGKNWDETVGSMRKSAELYRRHLYVIEELVEPGARGAQSTAP